MIYYISYSRIPDGDASSVRSCNLAKAFRECGFDVTLLGMGAGDYLVPEQYDGLTILSLRLKGTGLFSRLNNCFGFKRRIQRILAEADNINALILNINTLPINALWYLKNFSEKKGIKLFVDCCEWYSPQQFKFGKVSWPYIQNSYSVRRYIDARTGIIAISKYLLNYFHCKNYNAIHIPVVFDIERTCCRKTSKTEKLVLMYAGNIGKKDYLDVMLNGLSLLAEEELARIEFRVFGATLDDIKNCYKTQVAQAAYRVLKCYGRVGRQEVLRNLQDADFTVLMRSSTQRYAKAGFPTKVVESLACATPVICNLTSDLADYIKDGYNGLVVNGESAIDFSRTVKKALQLSIAERDIMSRDARTTAEQSFDFRIYKEMLSAFIRR